MVIIEIAKTIKEPTSELKEIMKEAYASLEGDFASFADLRDTLFTEPKDPKMKFEDKAYHDEADEILKATREFLIDFP